MLAPLRSARPGASRRAAAGVLSAALLLLAGGPGAARAGEVLQGMPRIVDGDTLYVQGQKIRLYAVDAPEKKQACGDAKGTSYMCGEKSLQALVARVGPSPVRCDVRSKDQYGRNVASCTILGPGAAKEDMGQWLVANGHAVAYRKIAPDYIPAEEKAKAQRVGIWSGSFTMPAKWRYEQRASSFDEGDDYPPTPRAGAPPRAPVSPSGSFGGSSSGGGGGGSGGAQVQAGRSYAHAAGGGGGPPAAAAAAAAAAQPQPQPAARPASYAAAAGAGLVPPDPGCAIKGNINSKGERIYHVPTTGAYDRVVVELDRGERWFCSEADARAAGFRAAIK